MTLLELKLSELKKKIRKEFECYVDSMDTRRTMITHLDWERHKELLDKAIEEAVNEAFKAVWLDDNRCEFEIARDNFLNN